MKDNFSKQAEAYAKYRPQYPSALFEHIISFVKEKKLAWDCGTGNGQTAKELARYFEQVYATDISSKQIEHAVKAHNIIYKTEPAEKTALEENSTDLITVSQALHWFDFDKFYNEVRRVSKPGGLIAVWTYSLLRIDDITNNLVDQYHFEKMKDYWDKERHYVDDFYKTIPFPFEEIDTAAFAIELNWDLQDLEGYLNTWSALQKFIATNNYNPVAELIERIKQHWPDSEMRKIIFPIHLKLAYVNK